MITCQQIEAVIEEFLEIKKTIVAVGGPNEARVRDTYEHRLTAAAVGVMMLFEFSDPKKLAPRIVVPVTAGTYREMRDIVIAKGEPWRLDRRAAGREVIHLVNFSVIETSGLDVRASEQA